MPRYVVTAVAWLDSDLVLDKGWLRAVTGSKVSFVGPNAVKFELSRRGSNAECAAERALIDINRAISPRVRLTQPPTWTARRAGLRGIGRRTSGWWHLGNGDDGLGGVREPRRPIPPTDTMSISLDPPA